MTVILFIATIAVFLGVDHFVRRAKGEVSSVPVRQDVVPAFRFPDGIFFSKTHTWLNLFPSGTVRLGVDDFVKRMFANPQVSLLKAEGDTVRKGEPIIRMQEGGNTFFVHSPIEGRVSKLNTRRIGSSKAATGDLFAQGWAYMVEPAGGSSDLRTFMLGAETRTWMKTELARLRDFIAEVASPAGELVPITLQDGGEPMPGILTNIAPDECARFERQFLSNE